MAIHVTVVIEVTGKSPGRLEVVEKHVAVGKIVIDAGGRIAQESHGTELAQEQRGSRVNER